MHALHHANLLLQRCHASEQRGLLGGLRIRVGTRIHRRVFVGFVAAIRIFRVDIVAAHASVQAIVAAVGELGVALLAKPRLLLAFSARDATDAESAEALLLVGEPLIG